MTAQVYAMDNEPGAGLPVNAEAEQALLGAILANNRAYDLVADFLRPEHFYHAAHGDIYAACAKLIEAGRQVDAVVLKNHFEAHEGLAEVGGAAYLANLTAAVVSLLGTKDYGRAIYDCAIRRQTIIACRETCARLADVSLEETGEQILYVTLAFTVGIEGMADEEARPLLNELIQHATSEAFVTRLHWEPGTLAVWDNRSTQHNALNDYTGQRREMLRVVIEGDRPA